MIKQLTELYKVFYFKSTNRLNFFIESKKWKSHTDLHQLVKFPNYSCAQQFFNIKMFDTHPQLFYIHLEKIYILLCHERKKYNTLS